VPSLLADRARDGVEERADIAPKRGRGGVEFVPVRYRVTEDWTPRDAPVPTEAAHG
jgi:hypothetical protein